MKTMIAAVALLLVASPAFAQNEPGDTPAKPKPAPAAAAPGPEAVVYNNALGPGWENWSFATVELGVDTGNPTRKPIRVEAKGWQALYLHHAPFSTAPYRGVSMLIQSVGGEADLRIVAAADGKPIPDPKLAPVNNEPIPKMKVVKVKPGGWTKVVVPLGEFGAADRTIDGLWVQNNTGTDAPKFYVADITLEP